MTFEVVVLVSLIIRQIHLLVYSALDPSSRNLPFKHAILDFVDVDGGGIVFESCSGALVARGVATLEPPLLFLWLPSVIRPGRISLFISIFEHVT